MLAEFVAVGGNVSARRIMEKSLCAPSQRECGLCCSQDQHIFHILRADGITFLCMANDTFGIPRGCSFVEVRDTFKRKCQYLTQQELVEDRLNEIGYDEGGSLCASVASDVSEMSSFNHIQNQHQCQHQPQSHTFGFQLGTYMNDGLGVSNCVGLSGLGTSALSCLGTHANLGDIENATNLMMVRMQVHEWLSLEQCRNYRSIADIVVVASHPLYEVGIQKIDKYHLELAAKSIKKALKGSSTKKNVPFSSKSLAEDDNLE
ncbi:hypothetical protein SUGI_1074330 [Cryptomeria japonica]|nr:hypothetical protein SUGI_1074330 [Cryptomeria japonica]